MIAILLAVLAFIGWGSGDILTAKLSRRSGAMVASFLPYLFVLLTMLLFIEYAPGQLTWLSFILSAGLGILLAVCYIGLNEAMRVGNPSIVGVVSSSFVSLVVIFSVVFFHESLTAWQITFIIPTILGVILTSYNRRDIAKYGWKLDRSIWISLAIMVGWGIYFTFIKIPLNISGWYWPNLVTTVIGALAIFLIGRKQISRSIFKKDNLKLGAITGLLSGAGTIGVSIALQLGKSAVVMPIAGAYPVLFVLLATFVFREKITRSQAAGMVISLVGIVGLAVVSG